MGQEAIKVLVVDDSAVFRGLWCKLIEGESGLEVAGTAYDGRSAIEACRKLSPDVVILDLEMPEMDGPTALPFLLEGANPPRVVIASALSRHGSQATIQALTLGASDYVTKPSGAGAAEAVREVGAELLRKIRELGARRKKGATCPVASPPTKAGPATTPKAIVVGSSTGGPNALIGLIRGLRPEIAAPVLVVQHMPAFFLVELAKRIEAECGRACRLPADGELVRPGTLYLAPGDYHMTLEREGEDVRILLSQGPAENFCRPAVDPLFRSAARVYGGAALAVVLTGMGEDGCAGALEIHRSGGCVVAQDEASSVVWGMPGAVVRAGIASAVMPVPAIVKALNSVFP